MINFPFSIFHFPIRNSRLETDWRLETGNWKFQAGQTLFELIIALAVAVLVVTGIIKIVTISVQNAAFAKNQAEATRFAQEGLEWLRAERDKDWDDFASRSNQIWCLSALAWQKSSPCTSSDRIADTIFTREADLSSLSTDSIEAILRVSWTDAAGSHESRLGTILTRWRQSQQ